MPPTLLQDQQHTANPNQQHHHPCQCGGQQCCIVCYVSIAPGCFMLLQGLIDVVGLSTVESGSLWVLAVGRLLQAVAASKLGEGGFEVNGPAS
jgi:hypothetical protein